MCSILVRMENCPSSHNDENMVTLSMCKMLTVLAPFFPPSIFSQILIMVGH